MELGSYDPPGPFASTKEWQEYLARLKAIKSPDNPILEDEIGRAETELKRHAKEQERLTRATYGSKPNAPQTPEPEDAIEAFYEFEKQQDHSVGLIFLIVFVGIGCALFWLRGMPFGFVIVSILTACIAWYSCEHAREKRRADAQKRRADALARAAARKETEEPRIPF
jgi:hypothetical protein